MKAGARLAGGGGGLIEYGGRPGPAAGIGFAGNRYYDLRRKAIKKSGYERNQPLQTDLTRWSNNDLIARELALEDMAKTARRAASRTDKYGAVNFADQVSLQNYFTSVQNALTATRNELIFRGMTKVATKIGI